jgi:stearoyl-CoA desaturase (delta-9 desaturase)
MNQTYRIIFLKLFLIFSGLIGLVFYESSFIAYTIIFSILLLIGNGVAGHRYWAHNQFNVNKFGRVLLGVLSTLTSYSPINYWIVQHQHHHRNSDTDKDIHSPNRGFIKSFFTWAFNARDIESVFQDRAVKIQLLKTQQDKLITFLSNNFVLLNLLFFLLLILINWKIFIFGYAVSFVIEYVRISLVNVGCHKKILFSYKNHQTKDNSYNNLLVGFLTLGFGWHNNHHNDSKKLILSEKWWEVDFEGYIAYGFKKIFYEKSNT